MNLQNEDLRKQIVSKGLSYKRIADHMKVRPDYLSRVFRLPLTSAMKERIQTAINELVVQGGDQ